MTYLNLIASRVPEQPEQAPEVKSIYPDEELELSITDFSEILTNGETSQLIDTFYSIRGIQDTVLIDVRTPEEHLGCD